MNKIPTKSIQLSLNYQSHDLILRISYIQSIGVILFLHIARWIKCSKEVKHGLRVLIQILFIYQSLVYKTAGL